MPSPHRRDLRPRKRPSQTRSQETVRAILTAAARVFAAQGYAGATTNRIADAAGVSIGSLYEYFPNKDALLMALMEAHIAEGDAILARAGAAARAAGLPLDAVVRRFVEAMIEFHARDRRLHRVLFEEAPQPPSIRRRLAEAEQRIAAVVTGFLRDHPAVTAPDHALAAEILVLAIEGLTHRLVVYGDGDAISAQTEEMVALATAYLTAPRRAAASPRRPT
jgi:AcrR family transcriptional regulator